MYIYPSQFLSKKEALPQDWRDEREPEKDKKKKNSSPCYLQA